LLLQLDASPHAWLEERGPRLPLVAAIDDATGTVPAAVFRDEEDAAGYLTVLHAVVTTVGRPEAVYHDRHTIFVPPPRQRERLEEQLAGEREPTQVGRTLRDLAIASIAAHSPQAKGRIERLWNTLQDRLVAELRLAGITTLAAATAFLPAFSLTFNARFARPAADTVPAWRSVPRGLDLDRLCSLYTEATVLNDNTVRTQGRVLQIPPGPGGRGYAQARVEVRHLLDGTWRLYHRDQLLATHAAASGPPTHSLRRHRYSRGPSPTLSTV
jgi:hypothetical protein